MDDQSALSCAYNKLKRVADNACAHRNYEIAMEALCAMARMQYLYNQTYKDDYIESMVVRLSELQDVSARHEHDPNAVLFYDGFGMDVRGLAYIYLKALIALGHRVIYVTKSVDDASQPLISELLRGQTIIHARKYESQGEALNRLRTAIQGYSFDYAFFYTTPFDIPGNIAFYELGGQCVRYLINLTDHAYWLGLNTFDYILEFRNYGASITTYERGVEPDRLLSVPYYPIIDQTTPFAGFSFDANGKRLIYSGGGLYKTKDPEGTYYRLVEKIICNHEDVIFYYTGSGNTSEIRALVDKYPGRVIYEGERPDLLEVTKRADLYLNTYPISGALMLQYAAVARCIPVTLRREWDEDATGILLNEDELGEIFTNEDDLLTEIDRLLSDEAYRADKQKYLEKSVISEECFTSQLEAAIRNPETIQYGPIRRIDTQEFREQYCRSMDINTIPERALGMDTIRLAMYIPGTFLRAGYRYIMMCIRSAIKG